MNLVLGFIAGAFLTNAVPHFVSGVKGKKHMTPLSRDSSAMTNVLWAYVNIAIGAWALNASGERLGQTLSFDAFSLSFWAGSIVMALSCAWLFSNPNASFPWFKK